MQHAGAKREGVHAPGYHTYVVLERADLKDADDLVHGDTLSQMPKEPRRQLIDFRNDDADLSDAGFEWPMSENGRSLDGGSKESPISHWDLGTGGVKNPRH